MRFITVHWDKHENEIKSLYANINNAIELLKDTLGGYLNIGRKYEVDGFSTRFNKVIFEVETVYFQKIMDISAEQKANFVDDLKVHLQTLTLEILLNAQQRI